MAEKPTTPPFHNLPPAIPELVSSREVKQVLAKIQAKYGERFNEQYCSDLIAFMDAVIDQLKESETNGRQSNSVHQ